jgi:hypothetical protein
MTLHAIERVRGMKDEEGIMDEEETRDVCVREKGWACVRERYDDDDDVCVCVCVCVCMCA